MLDNNRPGHSTGPRSPEGKRSSSRNSLTHGCCSFQIIVGDEKIEDFESLRDYWFTQFRAADPDTIDPHLAAELVEDLAINHWLLRRAQRNFCSVEHELSATPPMQWRLQDERKLLLMLRYKTSAERAFERSLRIVHRYVKEAIAIDLCADRLIARRRAELIERIQATAPPRPAYKVTPLAPKAFAIRTAFEFLDRTESGHPAASSHHQPGPDTNDEPDEDPDPNEPDTL